MHTLDLSMVRSAIVLFVLLAATQAGAQSRDEDDLLQAYGGKDYVSIATGNRQPLARAPAVASVITAADIEAMGATNLSQALVSVPGLHVTFLANEYAPVYIIRGVHADFNSRTLLLINGIPITSAYTGGQGQAWRGMPVANIARIEVIRGSGSALYGADAFSGVVNVITKTAVDLGGLHTGVRTGSYDSYDAWFQYGGRVSDWESAFSLEWNTTDGHDGVIESDAQTVIDRVRGTQASLAPGTVNTQYRGLDTRLDLSRGDWHVRAGYQARRDVGTGAGLAQALDPQGSKESDRINGDITYQKANIAPSWDASAQLSYFQLRFATQAVLFPSGAFSSAFPEGMLGNPAQTERAIRFNAATVYSGFRDHKLRIGAGYDFIEIYKVSESKNFSGSNTPFPGTPPPVLDVSESPGLVYLRPHERRVTYALLQDEWALAPDWETTAGLRYDHYSDFGGTLNPRFALVWQPTYRLTSKLLYGRAFRAPSFNNLYLINNPVALGNSNLKPETITTLELAFNYRMTSDTRTGLNFYTYEMENGIQFVLDPAPATARTAQNIGAQKGYGMEWEVDWNVYKAVRLISYYAFQATKDLSTGMDVANVPRHHAYLRTDWAFQPDWSLNAQINGVADRSRAVSDLRSKIDDYATVDLTLRRKHIARQWEVAASVRNLFDTNAREPSLAPGSILNDLPLPGRNYYMELRYRN